MSLNTVNSENNGFLLNDFLQSLERNDFSIDIDDYVVATQINNLFSNKELTVEQTKYSLAAIICRNAEEQEKFYQLFDDHIKKNIEEAEFINNKKEQLLNETKRTTRQKRIILFTFILLDIVLLILIFLCFVPIVKTEQYTGEKKPIKTSDHFTTDKMVSFSTFNNPVKNDISTDKKWESKQTIYQSLFKPSYDTIGLKVVWNFEDTIIKNKKNIEYRFKSSGKKNIAVSFLYNNHLKRSYKDSIFICEPPPNINVPDSIFVDKKVTFTATSVPNKSVIWTLDGQDTTTKSNMLEYTFIERGNHNISCKIQSQLCTHKGINNKKITVVNREVFAVKKRPDTPYIYPYSTTLSNIFYWLLGIALLLLLFCLLTLFIPYVYSLYAKIISPYFNAANRKKAQEYFKDFTEPLFIGNNPPIDISFYNKDKLIKRRQNIKKLGFDLQRKIATEDSKIDLKHTIKASIRNFDLLTPVYENKNAKRRYLFLIDVSNPKSTQIKLFTFLINHLKKSQVDLDVYYYFGDPIQVFKKEIDDSIDIKTLKDKYYQSVLIVFGNGYNFLDANAPEIYAPIQKEYSYWDKRILITPMPSLDWSVNEKILASFFHIVAADSSGLLNISSMLEKGHYNQKIANTKDIDTYTSKFIEFEDIESLKTYLVNDEMFQWLCAIAVYPKITWEIILSIGETINSTIVTYENLLKISRIKWVQNGNFPTRIRLELLKNLDSNYEIEARKTIIKLLEEESKKDDNSFSNNERIIQLIFNKFILFSYDPITFALYEKEEKEFLMLYRDDKIRDIPTKIYLKGVDPDKKDTWKSLMKESTEEGIDNLEQYYLTKTNPTPQDIISKNIKNYLRATSLFFLIIVSALAFIGSTKPNIDLFVHKQKLVPYQSIIKLNRDNCYKAFKPVKLIISDKGKIVYNNSLTEKDSIISLKSVFGKELSFQFISYKNDKISSVLKIQQPTSIVNIAGFYCNRIKAEFYGRTYDLYKDVLETEQLQTTNIPSSDNTNSLIFRSDVDSAFVYKLCLDLIKRKFPLQKIIMDKHFSNDEVKNADVKILLEQRKSDTKIIETQEELDEYFWGTKILKPGIEIAYFPKSNYDEAKKLEQAIIKSGFKYSKITFHTSPDGQVSISNEEGISVHQKDFQKDADTLAKIATNALKRKIISEKFSYNPYNDPRVLVVTLLKWTVLLNGISQSDMLYKYLENSSMKITLTKGEKIRNNNNCIYYGEKTTKEEAIEFTKDIIKQGFTIKALRYKSNLIYNVELAYNVDYDNCAVLTQDDLDNNQFGCIVECPSAFNNNSTYIIYFDSETMNLPPDGLMYLDKTLSQLKQNPNLTATILSHSSTGSKQSKNRLDSALSRLLKNGINSERIRAIDMGNKEYQKQKCFDRIEIKLIDNGPPLPKILWVDDHPENNADVINKFKSIGITVDLVKTNNEAIANISKNNNEYDFIITDIGRNNDEKAVSDKNKAGVELINRISDKSKIIIFSYPETIKKYQSELLKNGVTHFYSDFDELEMFILGTSNQSQMQK